MFHLRSLELLHWDYCQRLNLPLDGAIITVAGPNGSGKTTLLDAMRTLLGLDCSGGRSYKTYARHANADSAWLRATVDNRPASRQASSRPFARCLLYADVVTLVCRIERNGGDWQRRYCMVDGDVPIETLVNLPEKDWLGLEHWRKRLEGAGLSRAIARVLALEQGQTDRLCEYSPKELLRLVFDVFGDQEVLDRYEEARTHQRQLAEEVEAAERELAHAQTQLKALELRVNLYQQYQLKLREREQLATEVIPVLAWHEARQKLLGELRELHAQRLRQAESLRQRAHDAAQLLQQLQARQAAEQRVQDLEQERDAAKKALDQARDAERPVEELVKQAGDLEALAQMDGDTEQLAERLSRLNQLHAGQQQDETRLTDQILAAQAALDRLKGQRQAPPPMDVTCFQRALQDAGIAHHLVAHAIEITDDQWRAAAEGVLRGERWVVVLAQPADEARAMALAERERFRHYVVADAVLAPAKVDPDSLLAVLRLSAPVPAWLLRQLGQIRRVASVRDGLASGGEWITPEAYHRNSRGGRSVWVDPGEHQFGAAALASQRESIAKRLLQLNAQLTELSQAQKGTLRQLKDCKAALAGQSAADELLRRGDEFAHARQQLVALKAARVQAAGRWQALEGEHKQAVIAQTQAGNTYAQTQQRLKEHDQRVGQQVREWAGKRSELRARSVQSQATRRRFPARWIAAAALQALQTTYDSARQAQLRSDAVDRELEQGTWETDATVEEQRMLMDRAVQGREGQLGERKAHNELARHAVDNARDKYIDVLRATVRRYRKNIVELGQLAGVEVSAELPHLDNDDTVLRQAELRVHFNFDGKGQIGLNDGEASGGQQVIKSLILLVGLLKEDDAHGGFVFIDEPFAHLDVRNIQLVGHFLKSTRAQYVLTTPITHNVEVFEPADITLVTAKKPKGARWAPPIGVLQRRPEASVYG